MDNHPAEDSQLAIAEEQAASPHTEDNNQLAIPDEQPSKRRKKKSIVWQYFTIETVGPDSRRAFCNQCKQSFAYSTGAKVAGTSHLKRHIAKGTCAVFLRNQEKSLTTPFTPNHGGIAGGSEPPPKRRRYRSSAASISHIMFDQTRCRYEIANMMILHDYPLHMVEHPGFVAFVKNLQPRFDLMSFHSVHGDCIVTYLREKQTLKRILEGIPGRVCLTLDVCNSCHSVGYVVLTGHFIDSDWKTQRWVFNVSMQPYIDSDTAFSNAVSGCMDDWLFLATKIFSVTVNHPLSEYGKENIRALLSIRNPRILKGQLLLPSCIARTLSSMAKDILEAGCETVKKIRDSVKYVKMFESHEEKFFELKEQLQVPTEKTLFLDNQTEWNTSYQMLIAAFELKEVFSCFDTSDPDYKQAPSMQDWEKVEILCSYLRLLYDTANLLTTVTYPTTNTFFHEVWKIRLELARPTKNDEPFINNLVKTIREKFDKYWKDCSLVLGTAVVMDPRFKMKLVEFSFSKVYREEEAAIFIKIILDGIHELFDEYVSIHEKEGNVGNHNTDNSQDGSFLSNNGLTDFDAFIMESRGQNTKTELDQFLEESLLPRAPDFDVLGWWKVNKLKYPILAKMARDILSIPVCTVPYDSVFDMVGKEMDEYRSSLQPATVEALVCAKDWLKRGVTEVSDALGMVES